MEVKNIYITDLSDVHHYFLDIPIVKESYRMNAVKFALRSLYPGTEETSKFDYFCTGKSVVGLAANADVIDKYQCEDIVLVSPLKLAQAVVKDGVVYFVKENVVDEITVRQGVIESFFEYTHADLNELKGKLINYTNNENKVYAYFIHESSNLLRSVFEEKDCCIKRNIDSIKKSCFQDSMIFCEKKNTDKRKWLFICVFAIFAVAFFYDYRLYKDSELKQSLLRQTVQEYQELQKGFLNTKNASGKTYVRKIKTYRSPDFVLSQLHDCSGKMKLLSFSINGDSFRFEAENESALVVLNNMMGLDCFYDVTMHQSVPQKDGTERFVISGYVKND